MKTLKTWGAQDSMADIIGRCVDFYKEKGKKYGAS